MKVKNTDILKLFEDFLEENKPNLSNRSKVSLSVVKLGNDIQSLLDLQYRFGFSEGSGSILQEMLRLQQEETLK